MTEINFKGKEFVFNHHLAVPFRPLVHHSEKGVGPTSFDGNLVIHGDNLHALKALLPLYAGKVECIFIDPPYNTGNEDWSYSDNVNSPMIKEWLNSNPIGIEDHLRHDKWCAMMWPRLRLLHELLSDKGSIWITLDDNEVHHARQMLDEIFGVDSCIGQIAWQKRTSRENRAVLSPSIDHILAYSKSLKDTWRLFRNRLAPNGESLSNPDNDPRGPWDSIPFSAQGFRKNQVYKITTPTGKVLDPPRGRCWGATEPEFIHLRDVEKRVYWPKDGDGRPRIKHFPEHKTGLVPDTLWLASEVGDTESSKKLLLEIFSDTEIEFHAPKPVELIARIIEISTKPGAIVLDSFAGTATTAHAVLAANKRDNGDRRFIVIEMEDYADRLTAERIRRVIKGYKFKGTQKTELLREKLNWRSLEKAAELVHRVDGIENLEKHRFDKISKQVKDCELIVTGEKGVIERTDGLGGSFTYCTLGEAVELDKILTGETLPAYETLGTVLFHMATNQVLKPSDIEEKRFYLGETESLYVWLIYKRDLDWLKSPEAALTLTRARDIVKAMPGKKHLVFAPSRFVSKKLLQEENLSIEFVPLPFAIYRIERA